MKNISWKRNGIEIMNAPSNKIAPLSSTTPPPEDIRKLSQCSEILFNLRMEHFWRQNTMGYILRDSCYFFNRMKIEEICISWKSKVIETMNACSKNILLLSSTPYVTTRRMCTMGSNLFWRQNTMGFHNIFTKYSSCTRMKIEEMSRENTMA